MSDDVEMVWRSSGGVSTSECGSWQVRRLPGQRMWQLEGDRLLTPQRCKSLADAKRRAVAVEEALADRRFARVGEMLVARACAGAADVFDVGFRGLGDAPEASVDDREWVDFHARISALMAGYKLSGGSDPGRLAVLSAARAAASAVLAWQRARVSSWEPALRSFFVDLEVADDRRWELYSTVGNLWRLPPWPPLPTLADVR